MHIMLSASVLSSGHCRSQSGEREPTTIVRQKEERVGRGK